MPTIQLNAGRLDIKGPADPTIRIERPLVRSLALTGLALSVAISVAVPARALALAGQAPSLASSSTIAIPSGALSHAGQAFVVGRSMVLPVGGLSWSGQVATVQSSAAIAIPPGSLSHTGQFPVLRWAVGLPAGSLAYAGLAPAPSIGFRVDIPVRACAFSGQVPTVISGGVITIELNTPDLTLFRTSTPSLDMTATDDEEDPVRYQIQVSDNSGFTSGSRLTDSYDGTGGTGFTIHPQPLAVATTWEGEIQVDDRPGQSFTAGGGILDRVRFRFAAHETSFNDTDGTAYVRVYEHQGVFGISSAPRNPAASAGTPTPNWLAKSQPFPFSPGNATFDWREFTFIGANRVRLRAGTKYMVILDWIPTNRTITNTITVQARSNSGNHAGNVYIDGQSANNGPRANDDMLFEVYEVGFLLDKTSGTDPGFVNTQDGVDTDPFTSGQLVRYTVPDAIFLPNTTYYWKARATDLSTTSDYTSARSFVVIGNDAGVRIG